MEALNSNLNLNKINLPRGDYLSLKQMFLKVGIMKKLNWKIALIIIVFILIGNFVYGSFEHKSFVWKEGEKRMYDYDSHSTTLTKTFDELPWSKTEISVHGKLNFIVYEIKGEVVRLGFQLYPIEILQNGKEYKKLEKIYGTQFVVDTNKNGRFEKFYFSNEIAKEDEEKIKSLIDNFQLIFSGNKSEWSLKESNSAGEYLAEYFIQDDLIKKVKKEYTEVYGFNSKNAFNATTSIEVEASLSDFSVSEERSWIEKVRILESLKINLNEDPVITIKADSMLSPIPFEQDSKASIWENTSIDEVLKEFSQTPKKEVSFFEEEKQKQIAQKLENENFNSLFNQYTKETSSKNLHNLAEYLKLHPKEVKKIPRLILRGGLNDNIQAKLFLVLEKCGNEEAQKALLSMSTDTRHTNMNRIRAIMHVGDVKSPSQKTIEKLWLITNKKDTGMDKNVANTAILSLGRIGNTIENQELSDGIKQKLIQNLENKKSDAELKSISIEAIGNTRDEELIKKTLPYLKNDDSSIRYSVVSALSQSKNPETIKELDKILPTEKEVTVREEILRTYLSREPNKETFETVEKSYLKEKDPSVRAFMIEYVARNKSFDKDIDQKLKAYLNFEKDPGIRKKIYKALYSKNYNKN